MVGDPMVSFEQHGRADHAVIDPLALAASLGRGVPASDTATAPDDASLLTIRGRGPDGEGEGAPGPCGDAAQTTRHHDLRAPGTRFAAAIEAALVPRLMLAHGLAPGHTTRRPDQSLAAALAPFTAALLTDDAADSTGAQLAALRARGVGVPALCLDLLAPAARRLGEMWEDDTCDFASVTMGLTRLHRILHDLHPQGGPMRPPLPGDPRREVLLAVSPGEQHVFGIAMVGEFLRQAGWEVCDGVGATPAELARLVRRRWFTVVALSASRASLLDGLASTIRGIRAASCHRGIGVMVGGRIFATHQAAAAQVGADATATDAHAAVAQAEGMLTRADTRAVTR
jgi:methanogenic corrinoid protein MtbC1